MQGGLEMDADPGEARVRNADGRRSRRGSGGQVARVSLTGRATPGEGGGEASSGRLLLNHLQVHLQMEG